MSLIRNCFIRATKAWGVCIVWAAMASLALAQTISTTTVQGTVYLANGAPGSGTLQVSWPAFTTASNQAVPAGKITSNIGADGFVSVNLAPNLGSSPAGLYYTAIYHMSDGTTSTEYWVIPAAAQASIGQVRSQVMPAAQAVQAVSKAYVDQAIQSVALGNLTSTGGQLTGPLYLTGDPTQSLQAADKHYVDSTFAQAVPLTGGTLTGPLTAKQLGAAFQVDQFSGADFGAKLQACLAAISSAYGGTCDARNFSGNLSMAADLSIATANATVMLPCATISTASQIIVTAGTRNVSLRGCSLRGASNASGSQGGTVLLYSGSDAAVQVGDPMYAVNTLGFHLDNVLVNTTASSSSSAQAIAAYRTQELDLESLYLLGNANQTGITLDGTGNYTGGTFYDSHISGFQTAINGIGHQVTNSAATDWLNASTFVRLHIDCPTENGNPISGTYGINLQQGDGNSFTGGDVEGCATALHLGANAQNNTILGLRNENSTYQVVADAGSSYNSWMTGGTMFTGKLSDSGTRNSFLDTFHRSFNSLNGDWYGSQQDATVTNHFRLGIGNGNERGMLDRYQTDYGYRWTMGLSDASGGEQFYQILDELNNVYRISVGQYNNGQASTNNQTVINAAGTGAVVLNGSNNSGTGGVVFGSGGANETTVATVGNTGNAQFNGTLQVGGTTQSTGTMTVRNNADAEVDYYLWPGLTASQKGSFTYKDYNGNSQWYMVKDASNNWALNSATGGLDSFKAYQSTNSGDTYINASNSSGVVRVNYEAGSGSAFNIYGAGSANLYASFSGANSIKFPGLSASSGRNCLQIDSSGYISNTGLACGAGSGSGTVNSGATGQIAYYNGNGAALSGLNSVPIASGGTGASTAADALLALGGVSQTAPTPQNVAGPLNASINSQINVMAYGAKGDCSTDDGPAIQAAMNAAQPKNQAVYFPKPIGGCYLVSTITWNGVSLIGQQGSGDTTRNYTVIIRGKPGYDVLHVPDPSEVTPTWNGGWAIENILIQVDKSQPVTTATVPNYIHRWPGRWSDDANMTAGSNVLTGTLASCGDIGQAIQVNGAGTGGANLVSTIASVTPCWASASSGWQVVTLADNASTTVANAHVYVSVLGLPVTQNIPNCAIAMDNRDGNPANWVTPNWSGIGNIYNIIHNLNITSVGAGNNACGIYIQGGWGPYGLHYTDFTYRGLQFAFVQSTSEFNSWYQSSSNDYQTISHGSIESTSYPWISYNGGNRVIEDVELTTNAGMQFLKSPNKWADTPGNGRIIIPEYENYIAPTVYGFRDEGVGDQLTVTFTENPSGAGYIGGTNNVCNNCSGNVNIGGANNVVWDGTGYTINDWGRGNTVLANFVSSSVLGIAWNRDIVKTPSKGSKLVGQFTGDNFFDGNPQQYNHNDLIIWPQDILFGNTTPYSRYIVPDATSPSGYYMNIGGPTATGVNATQFEQNAWNGTNLGYIPVGTAPVVPGQTSLPSTGATLYFLAKCASGTTTFTVRLYPGTANNPETCSTTYQAYSVSVPFSGATGNLQLIGSTNTFQAAYFVIVPWRVLDSPTISNASLTGVPTAPTAAPGTNNTQVATTAFVAAAGVPQPYFDWIADGNSANPNSGNHAAAANTAIGTSYTSPTTATYTKVTYYVNTADNSANLYDVGWYNSTGVLICHTGATAGTTFAPTTGFITLRTTTACSFTSGMRYYFAYTGNATTLKFGGPVSAEYTFSGSLAGATSGGALNGTITPPTDSFYSNNVNTAPWVAMHN